MVLHKIYKVVECQGCYYDRMYCSKPTNNLDECGINYIFKKVYIEINKL